MGGYIYKYVADYKCTCIFKSMAKIAYIHECVCKVGEGLYMYVYVTYYMHYVYILYDGYICIYACKYMSRGLYNIYLCEYIGE